ncbi:MAG: phospholipase D-like domain-containing protein [Fibromonadaceae bacterium]|jgi:ERCC4-related helicase|nr:phospholipase D-like domain-containing protein [Fibromonadaceae bacterium]
MLLDNEKQKVCKWIEKYTSSGKMYIVTGYFTIGALVDFSEKTQKIEEYYFILGDIANRDYNQITTMDLLNSEKSIEKVLKLKKDSKRAVEFLEKEKVNFKTLEPNFCHAKVFLYKSKDDDPQKNYYIMGSSNLTEAGIGLRHTSNVELNVTNFGSIDEYGKLVEWFETLWEKNPKAHETKTIISKNGKSKEVNFKKHLIEEISKIFLPYSPNDIYLKILAEMNLETNVKMNLEIETTLEKSKIYDALYDFQRAGAISLVKMLEQHNGAILADAVGLGKTWTALAVIKFYQKKGFDIVVICPKKLEHNWLKWKKKFNSKFKEDGFDYFIRFHTDLEEERMQNKGQKETSDAFFISEKPKLFVIDESHNLRNNKSKRYIFLLENILKKNENAKVLMLSATPINNHLWDIRNQLKLIPQIQDTDSYFRTAQGVLNKWANEKEPKLSDLIKGLPSKFIDITDKFTVARTRSMVEQRGINFPKWQIQNYDITSNCIKDCKSFKELLDLLPTRFSAYMPAFYAEKISGRMVKNESQRDLFLVNMMHFLLLKRLESSWYSFCKTVEKILKYHEMVLEKISKYQDFESEDFSENGDFNEDEIENLEQEIENLRQDFELGKKRKIKISEIKNIDAFKKDLNEDIISLQDFFNKLKDFNEEEDDKLLKLLEAIKEKPKVLIFTTYKDTAEYLYKHISGKDNNTALVTGETKNIEEILQRFAPLAKFEESERNAECEQKRDLALKEPIKILITTDVLSEGQNLQDCDFVINYDIHWNPVRAIQRMGRIDRLGSKHKTIYCTNFWPTKSINDYLNLQSRIEKRMIAMKIAGSEIPHEFTDKLKEMNNDKALEQKQIVKNLKLMKDSNIEEIESQIFGLNNLSYESFRQDLTIDSIEKYKSMPNGIFSGFLEGKNGLIALLKHKKDNEIKLAFINMHGKEILLNKVEVLSFLRDNRLKDRFVSQKIEECDESEIKKLSNALNEWFKNVVSQIAEKEIDDLNEYGLSITNSSETIEQKYQTKEWNLLCWCLVSEDMKNES